MRPFDTLGFVLTCVASASLAARQRRPVTVALFYVTVWALFVYLGYWSVVNSPGALLALYTVAALRPLRVTAAVAAVGGLVWFYAAPGAWILALVQSVVWIAVIARFGYNARLLAVRNAQLLRLADRLAFGQEERARRAVVDEQIRIARELHDVVAHHMSVVSVHAGLVEFLMDNDRTAARGSITTVMDASTEALAEMRRLLSVLRPAQDSLGTGASALPHTASLARLDDLVDRVRLAGVPVDVTQTGQQRPLPPGLDVCVYRVIQEALTNVLKHANASSVTITLEYGHDQLSVRVVDDGQPAPVAPGAATTGHGIIGMRDRAKLYGGTLTASPRTDGGFEVALTVPVE